jgi:hypothetical protein
VLVVVAAAVAVAVAAAVPLHAAKVQYVGVQMINANALQFLQAVPPVQTPLLHCAFIYARTALTLFRKKQGTPCYFKRYAVELCTQARPYCKQAWDFVTYRCKSAR